MSVPSLARGLGLALILCGLAAAARAQTPPPPTPDPGVSAQSQCISDSGAFKVMGEIATFVLALENKCDRRLRCRVYLHIVNARGTEEGSTTLTLGPRGGAAARKSFVMQLKMMGRWAQSMRACEAM